MDPGARKSTNMVPVDSSEKGGAEVLCVFEAKPRDCAMEEAEANDRSAVRRHLGTEPLRSPGLMQRPNTARPAKNDRGGGESKTVAAHLRCIVGKIPPICFAFSAPTLGPKVFTAFVGFVFFPPFFLSLSLFLALCLFWKQKSFDSELSL